MADFRLAEWLDARLEHGDVSAAAVARESGLGEDVISKLRKGIHKGGSFEKLGQLARGLGMKNRAELVAAVDGDPPPVSYDPVERMVECIIRDETLGNAETRLMLRLYLSYQPESRARQVRERYGLAP